MLGDDVAVIFFAGAAEGFEYDDEEDYADAGAGEGGLGFDAPGAGDEAWVVLVRAVRCWLEGREWRCGTGLEVVQSSTSRAYFLMFNDI